MQKCATCDFQSPEGAKFCRQCGAPLYAENELSGADTRNYGRQESAPAVSAPLPPRTPSVVDAFGSETIRYRQAPAAAASVGTSNLPNVGFANAGPMFGQAAPMYAPPAVPTSSIKPKRRVLKGLKWIGMGFLLFVAGGIGAGINQESNRQRIYLSPEDRGRLERMRAEDRLNRNATGAMLEINSRIRESLDRQIEDINRAKEDALRAVERGVPVVDEDPLSLNEFDYPSSTSSQSSRIPNKELLTLRTTDDFETIVQYYQTKLGKPYVVTNERNNRRALFQTSGKTSVTVLVQESNDRNREKIIILRSPYRFPKPISELATVPSDSTKKAGSADGKPANLPADSNQVAPIKPARIPENR